MAYCFVNLSQEVLKDSPHRIVSLVVLKPLAVIRPAALVMGVQAILIVAVSHDRLYLTSPKVSTSIINNFNFALCDIK